MGEKIAFGFHTCVDFELKWDSEVIEQAIRDFGIHDAELTVRTEVSSERELWVAAIAYLKAGIGGEIIPADNVFCESFASRFEYEITLGGTALRAAIAIQKLGFSSAVQLCCYNNDMKRLIPKEIQIFSAVGDEEDKRFPHVILTFPGKAHIQENDIDITTRRENRVMISRDEDSLNMMIREEFAPYIEDAEVFLASCFSQVLDEKILRERLDTVKRLLGHLPEDALVVMEDGCYVKPHFRRIVHEELLDCMDILSMNEDEFQDFIGARVNLLDAEEVLFHMSRMKETIGVGTIVIHSSRWALAYGEKAWMIENALVDAVALSATRFCRGDDVGPEDFAYTKTLTDLETGAKFCSDMRELLGDQVRCVPCKDLSFISHPTVVGLGDCFAGGLALGLTRANRNRRA